MLGTLSTNELLLAKYSSQIIQVETRPLCLLFKYYDGADVDLRDLPQFVPFTLFISLCVQNIL